MSFIGDLVGGITGSTAGDAAREAGQIQSEAAQTAIDDFLTPASERSLARLDPFAAIGQQGVDLAGFLTDPTAQFDFLKSNPLFKLSLDRLDDITNTAAASRGRLSAGDTLQQLSNNTLLASQPLIDRQRQDILNLINLGQGVAGQQSNIDLGTASQSADLLTGGAAAQAAGTVGEANARGGLLGNVLSLGSTPFSSIAPSGSLFGAIGDLF